MPNPFFDTPRIRRLKRDFQEMEVLKSQSSILDFEMTKNDFSEYEITFHGKGLDSDEKPIDKHELVVRLGMNYPMGSPDIIWKTDILHPNIGGAGSRPCFGTFIMNSNVRLVDIIEILWDMARLAVYNPYHGSVSREVLNEIRKKIGLPLDERILRDKLPPAPKPAPEEQGEADLIIMSGAGRRTIKSQDWIQRAVEQYFMNIGLDEHVMVYTGSEWSFNGDGSGQGSMGTMLVDRYLFEKLQSQESEELLQDFNEFLNKMGLTWVDGSPGKVHFFPRTS